MKKIIAMLLALVMVFALVACAAKTETPTEPATENPAAETPAADEPAAEEPAEEPAATASGKVYYLNFKPEFDTALQQLAADYTAKTGVEVKVVTAASGTYSDTLTAEMAKSDAPTIFNIGNVAGLNDWDEYAIDLTGTAIAEEQSSTTFNLYNDAGELKALGHCYESYGIIVNKDLLAAAGYAVEDITDFESLKAVADDIHARADELGFDAFSAPGLHDSSSWRFSGHLANLPLYYQGVNTNVPTITDEYLDNFKAIWDLYITDTAIDATTLTSSTGDESKAEFTEGKAVFYQNGTWEYASLIEAGMTDDQLQMIPIYCGADGEENAALCSGTENCWAINANASAEDQQASIDFLVWLVTDPAASATYVEQLGAVPFKNCPASTNKFINDGNALLADGKYAIAWAFNYTPNVDSWRATVVTALAAYSADQSDANWEQVVSAFVDGWAIEYETVNG